jgi:hypothetical protein
LARAYYFWNSQFSREERKQRHALFGSFKEGLTPVKAFWWQCSGDTRLLEIPVTTVPGIKTPFHLSYLLYLSRFSTRLMTSYLTTALILCRVTGTGPSFLLHPLDFFGDDRLAEFSFFPAMKIRTERKIELFRRVIAIISDYFEPVSMSSHALSLMSKPEIKVINLRRQKARTEN